MIDCCQCQGIEIIFDQDSAAGLLKEYHKNGPKKTTELLLDQIKSYPLEEMSLLDIGGGVGTIQHELINSGVTKVTSIEASTAYLQACKLEAEQQGHADKIQHHHGNFIDLAIGIPPADIVTLDRVVCCFPDMPNMVSLSAAKAKKLYGLVYPRSEWWSRWIMFPIMNFYLWLVRRPFRVFVHPPREVEKIIEKQGLVRRYHQEKGMWQVVLYARASAAVGD